MYTTRSARVAGAQALPWAAARLVAFVALLVTLLLVFVLSALRDARAPAACDAQSPLVYDAVMDAGSTGSRIYVYAFERRVVRAPHIDDDDGDGGADGDEDAGGQGRRRWHGSERQTQLYLRAEYVKRVRPGLSSYMHNHRGAGRSLAGLLRSAVRFVPARHRRCTAVVLKATAGLRLLPRAEQTALLHEAAAALQRTPLRSQGASIITGSEEAVYGWLTINYLLGRLYNARSAHTVTIDMGGGSAQVVFATSHDAGAWLPFSYVTQLRLGPRRRVTLYRHSYLGLGLNEARRTLLRSYVDAGVAAAATTTTATTTDAAAGGVTVVNVSFPCVPPGSVYGDDAAIAQLIQHAAPTRSDVKVVLRNDDDDNDAAGARTFDACAAVFAQRVLRSNATCAFRACGHDGVPQPPLAPHHRDVYVFSYFFDLIRAVYAQPDTPVYVRSFRDAGVTLCGDARAAAAYASLDARNACIDFAYLYAFLRNGLRLDDAAALQVQHTIDGKAVAWSLGASLASLLALDV